MSDKIRKFLTALPCLLLCACMVGPDFESPKADLPDSWSVSDEGRLLTDDDSPAKLSEEELSHWWTIFGDPVLVSLVERAFKGNLDIADAQAKIAQARSTLGVTQSSFFPSLDANASFSEGGRNMTTDRQTFGLGAETSWEIDVFGGTRRGVESALASYNESLATKCATRLSVAAEVAQNYFRYRAIQQQIIIVNSNLQTQIKTSNITKRRKFSGMDSKLDIVRAEAQVESTRAQIPQLESELALMRHSLELLLGLQSGALKKELEKPADLPELERFIPLGVPAKLVRRRPDIIAAEYAMHAATAEVGVATADFYPKFHITGNISYQAPNVGDIVTSKYGTWSVGPSVSWNLFQGGRVYFNVELQKAVAQASKISWQLKVLTALKEVEDAIVSAAKERERIVYLNSVVKNSKEAYELSFRSYTEGVTEFLDLLDSQRSMLEAQQNQLLSRQLFINHIVSLYKSVGGGWTAKDLEDAGIRDSFLENYLDAFFTRDNSTDDFANPDGKSADSEGDASNAGGENAGNGTDAESNSGGANS